MSLRCPRPTRPVPTIRSVSSRSRARRRKALRAWYGALIAQGITTGKIFRGIRHGRIVEGLRADAVRDIVRRRAKLADQPLGRLSAHSLRSGFVTEAGKQGIGLGDTMALTGHRSVQTVMDYYQSGEVGNSRAARLMDDKETK